MKKSLIKILLSFFFAFTITSSFGIESCWCEFEEQFLSWDYYSYSVDGDDCCESTPVGNSGLYEKNIWIDGGWTLIDYQFMSGSAAQEACCPPN